MRRPYSLQARLGWRLALLYCVTAVASVAALLVLAHRAADYLPANAGPVAHAGFRLFTLHAAVVIPALMGVILLVAMWMVRRALLPLREVSRQAAEIGPTTTCARLPEHNLPDEVAPLVVAVNRALARLEQGFATQRQFTASAAHELRTPLAIMSCALETMDDTPDVRSLKADTARMNRLVEQLLRIARLDAIPLDVSRQVDLAAIAATVVENLAPWAITRQRPLALEIDARTVFVPGNAQAIEDAIRNLIENAIAHAPRDSEIGVHVHTDHRVSVADRGPGVPAADRPHLFKRFWRGTRSEGGGAGLGLAIVADIMTAHGGTVNVEDNPGGGARFILSFPNR